MARHPDPSWVRDGMNKPVGKDVWGPEGWDWLHTEAILYPVNPTPAEQRAAYNRFWKFVLNLPCEECRGNATKYAGQLPPDFSGSVEYQAWAWGFHNAKNRMLGKPVFSWQQYLDKYKDLMYRRYEKLV